MTTVRLHMWQHHTWQEEVNQSSVNIWISHTGSLQLSFFICMKNSVFILIRRSRDVNHHLLYSVSPPGVTCCSAVITFSQQHHNTTQHFHGCRSWILRQHGDRRVCRHTETERHHLQPAGRYRPGDAVMKPLWLLCSSPQRKKG